MYRAPTAFRDNFGAVLPQDEHWKVILNSCIHCPHFGPTRGPKCLLGCFLNLLREIIPIDSSHYLSVHE